MSLAQQVTGPVAYHGEGPVWSTRWGGLRWVDMLAGVFAGDPTLSVRGDQAVQAWRVVEPVLGAWREDRVPLQEYPAGSDGPAPQQPNRRKAG